MKVTIHDIAYSVEFTYDSGPFWTAEAYRYPGRIHDPNLNSKIISTGYGATLALALDNLIEALENK